ncbi:NAD(P)-dependent glycerol-3-phosphate dehydrogenase [Chitinispirillales bacterium ANBcel5]|uniref:NAD(P)H-dependent glycerol-3-phosphate dehydrogenase n=1 Tax=Cellulosispirillum alkaliphilum TaxID=3039283 RepID=UPI002A50C67E|nr:NAD(P)-dependent glycerol-3-phosphate dehydrogenase [Chitinispirillales bacterium ANBcel5]
MNIGILGAGSWGIALAVMLQKRSHKICMWEYNEKDARFLQQNRELPSKLPGVKIPQEIEIVNTIDTTIEMADVVLCVVPSQTMRATLKSAVSKVSEESLKKIRGWVIASKGIERNTLALMTDVLLEEIPGVTGEKIVVLSGPSHAEEVSRNIPTTVVAASENIPLAEEIQEQFSTETFRIYTNSDMKGVELAASVKNVIALAAGISDGMGFGDNTKGAIMTRGIVEMMRLGRKMGAQDSTFSGLAGIGDLITTCISKHSRNRQMGELIAKGYTLDEAKEHMTMIAEGVETTRSVYQLASKLKIEMPITTQIYKVLFEDKPVKEAVKDLMHREAKPEWW